MWLLLAAPLALGHGNSFTVTAISEAPDGELWYVSLGWGAFQQGADGEFLYTCDEAVGSSAMTDVLALGGGEALLASYDGLLHYDADCGLGLVPGLPDGDFPTELVRLGDAVYAAVEHADPEADMGVYRCSPDGCEATPLVGPEVWPKSLVTDGTTLWVTLTAPDLSAALWRSADGEAWEQVRSWPAGSDIPELLAVRGEHIFLWWQTREEEGTNRLERSDDAGGSWANVLEAGAKTDEVPAMVELGAGAGWLLGNSTLRLYQSFDDGLTWVDANAAHLEHPAIRCASDDGRWACTDHFADGYDLARVSGFSLVPVTCMDRSAPAGCVDGGCDATWTALADFGSYGGGRCTWDEWAAAVEAADPALDEGGCGGCGGADGGDAAALALFALAGALAGGRRSRRAAPGRG